MKISLTSKKSAGFALLATMACIVILLIIFTSAMYWVLSDAQQTRKNGQFTSSEAAAEGATELIFAHMDRDYLYANFASASNYDVLTPDMTNWPVQYTYDVNVNMGQPAAVLSYLGGQYTNLVGEPQVNTVTVTATPLDQLYNVPATVSQSFTFATVPAFQFAIFYNLNLEIDPGRGMPILGAVFSNQGIWSGTANVTYSSTVEAAGQVNTSGTDPFCSGKTDGGTPQANFQYTGTPSQPESDVNPLELPIGANSGGNSATNVEAIINIPPPSVAAPQSTAYQQTNQVYGFNAASLIVSNAYYGTNGELPGVNAFTVYLQDSVPTPQAVASQGSARNWVQLTNDYYIISNSTSGLYVTNWVPGFQFSNYLSSIQWVNPPTTFGRPGTNTLWYAGFSFLTNAAFYDFREGTMAQAVQLDVGKLGEWITNNTLNAGSNWNQELCSDTGHGINSVYIYNAVPFIGQQQLPVVRVVDGQLLPSSYCTTNGQPVFTSGLTVITPQPLYVWGNYNVQTNGGPMVLGSTNDFADTYPAAFMADSITILSLKWQDLTASAASQNYSTRPTSNTTINAACLEGIVPSSGSDYSGGVENFMRLLEDWDSTVLTYNGSILVMFPSEYATNIWQTPDGSTSYYGAPQRNWGFDTNFLIEADLPPLTPNFRTVIRNSWSGY